MLIVLPLCGAFESEATSDKLKRAHTQPGKFSLNGRIEKERLMVQASLNINRNALRPNLLNHFWPIIWLAYRLYYDGQIIPVKKYWIQSIKEKVQKLKVHHISLWLLWFWGVPL